jgi:transcriptional regulator with XRE-family HTH domain
MTVIRYGALFGPMLRSLRAVLGMTQAELSARTSTAASQISKYEISRALPDFDTAARLLGGLDHCMVVMPRIDARTLEQRTAVIAAARAWYANPGEEEEEEVMGRAVMALEVQTRAAREAAAAWAPDPYGVIERMRQERDEREAEMARLRAAITTARSALSEVSE